MLHALRFLLLVMALPVITQAVSAAEAQTGPSTESFSIDGRDGPSGKVPFFLYRPAPASQSQGISQLGAQQPAGLLLLIPGFNGPGEAMLDDRWKQFADQHHLILLAPTFTSVRPEELHNDRGYYYPAQGSGDEVEQALEEAHRRTGVQVDQILIFGFSAGAHFAHRFALWRPEQVKAFVAYSAAWWSDPTEQLRDVPALIMCGESDERYEPTLAFMQKGLALHLPWIWRSYKNTDHELTPPVRAMAEVFLDYYASQMKGGSKITDDSNALYGDMQTYQVIPASEKESIPEQVRILLPSQAIADTWVKEN